VGMSFPRQVTFQDHHPRFMRVVKHGYRAVFRIFFQAAA
jgi:hypothetical protein